MTEIRPVSTKMTSFEKEGVQGAVEMSNGLYNVVKSAGSTIWDCTKAVAEGAVDIVDGVVDTATGAVKYAGALVKTPFGGILDIASKTDKDDVKTEAELQTEKTLAAKDLLREILTAPVSGLCKSKTVPPSVPPSEPPSVADADPSDPKSFDPSKMPLLP